MYCVNVVFIFVRCKNKCFQKCTFGFEKYKYGRFTLHHHFLWGLIRDIFYNYEYKSISFYGRKQNKRDTEKFKKSVEFGDRRTIATLTLSQEGYKKSSFPGQIFLCWDLLFLNT